MDDINTVPVPAGFHVLHGISTCVTGIWSVASYLHQAAPQSGHACLGGLKSPPCICSHMPCHGGFAATGLLKATTAISGLISAPSHADRGGLATDAQGSGWSPPNAEHPLLLPALWPANRARQCTLDLKSLSQLPTAAHIHGVLCTRITAANTLFYFPSGKGAGYVVSQQK